MNTLFLTIAFVASSLSQTQTVEPVRGIGIAPIYLLNSDLVRSDIGIEDEMCRRLNELFAEFEQQAAVRFLRPRPESDGVPERRNPQEFSRDLNALRIEYSRRAQELCTADQRERLQQITWHLADAMRFGDPEFLDRLDLTNDQDPKIRICMALFQRQATVLVHGRIAKRLKHSELQHAIKRLDSQLCLAIESILDDRQRDLEQAALGRPIAFRRDQISTKLRLASKPGAPRPGE